MKTMMRGTSFGGEGFEEIHHFEYCFELFQIVRDVRERAPSFEIWLSTDVNAAEAEPVLAAAFDGTWHRGVCRGAGASLTRLTGSGGCA